METTGTATIVQGLEVTNPFIELVVTTEAYTSRYICNTRVYATPTAKSEGYQPTSIIDAETKTQMNTYFVIRFDEVVGVEGELVSDTIRKAFESLVEAEMQDYGLERAE